MTTNGSAVLAWHFVGATLRDGRPVPADGEWLVHDGPVVWCCSGLYASRDPFDALEYAPGANLCRVECADVVDQHADKLVCRRRRIIKRRDATEMLLAFARWSALQVTHLWRAPSVVKRFLQTGDDSLLMAAAWAAAYAAYDPHAAYAYAAYAYAYAAYAYAAYTSSDDASSAAAAAARAARAAYAEWATADAGGRGAVGSALAAQRAEFNRRVQELFQ